MAVDFVLAPEAEQDVREAYDWYESCRNGLGEEFLGCVDAVIERICRTPDFCAKVISPGVGSTISLRDFLRIYGGAGHGSLRLPHIPRPR